jgi:hypothetical protein
MFLVVFKIGLTLQLGELCPCKALAKSSYKAEQYQAMYLSNHYDVQILYMAFGIKKKGKIISKKIKKRY